MKFLYVFMLLIIMVPGTFGQTSAGAGVSSPSRRTTKARRSSKSSLYSYYLRVLENVEEQIKADRPEILDKTLAADRDVILSSIIETKEALEQRGFYGKDVEMAVAAGWRHLRVDHMGPNAKLSLARFNAFVATLGKIIIKTQPEEVEVTIDNTKLPRTTDTSAFCTPGPHRIVLSKPGYQTLEDHFYIVGDGKLVFQRQLNKQ